MKKVTRTLLSMMVISNLSFAGGDFTEAVEPVVTVPVVEVNDAGFYLGLGIAAVITYEEAGSFFDPELGQERTGDLALLAGYDFNKYIAIEARYMTTVAHDDILDRTFWAVYVKPQYPVTEDFNIYGLLGYGNYQLDGKNGSGIDIDENGFQWGLGASYEVVEDISIFIDYISIAKGVDVPLFINTNIDIDSDAVTIGMTYKF